jgi:hypothetical protein
MTGAMRLRVMTPHMTGAMRQEPCDSESIDLTLCQCVSWESQRVNVSWESQRVNVSWESQRGRDERDEPRQVVDVHIVT